MTVSSTPHSALITASTSRAGQTPTTIGTSWMKIHQPDFKLQKFAPFVHENNVLPMVAELENARYHVMRNGNSRIIFTDLSIKLTRLLHTRAA